MKEDLKAARDIVNCYVKDDIAYVPHYQKWGVYVGPGYSGLPTQKTYSALELESLGARKHPLFLWNRPQAPKLASI